MTFSTESGRIAAIQYVRTRARPHDRCDVVRAEVKEGSGHGIAGVETKTGIRDPLPG